MKSFRENAHVINNSILSPIVLVKAAEAAVQFYIRDLIN